MISAQGYILQFKPATNINLQEIYAFRYQNMPVTNKEKRFPSQLILDEYDEIAHHAIARNKTNNSIVFVARMFFSDESRLPIEDDLKLGVFFKCYRCVQFTSFVAAKKIRGTGLADDFANQMIDYVKNKGYDFMLNTFRQDTFEQYWTKRGLLSSDLAFSCHSKICPYPEQPHKMGFNVLKPLTIQPSLVNNNATRTEHLVTHSFLAMAKKYKGNDQSDIDNSKLDRLKSKL